MSPGWVDFIEPSDSTAQRRPHRRRRSSASAPTAAATTGYRPAMCVWRCVVAVGVASQVTWRLNSDNGGSLLARPEIDTLTTRS